MGIWLALGTCSVLSAETGWKFERGGVIFYAGFESKDADFSALGSTKAILREGGAALTADGFDSVRNRALRSGDGIGYLEYAIDRDIAPDDGTIEIWIKPDNYRGYDGDPKGRHTYIEIPGEGGGAVRYSLWADGVSVFEVRGGGAPEIKHWDDKTPRSANTAYGNTMKPGTYTQYFLVWKKGEFIAYYRGYAKPPATTGDHANVYVHKTQFFQRNVPSPGKLTRIRIGDFGGAPDRDVRSYIDEVYIYNRALTYEECVWSNQYHTVREKGMDIPSGFMKAQLDVLPDPRHNEIEVTVDSARLDARVHGLMRLEPAAGTRPASITPRGKRYGAARIAYAKLPAGDYRIIAELTDEKGSDLGTVEKALTVPDVARWIGNTVGISNTPPRPWPPMNATKDTVSVWGRKYTLGELGLPKDINISVRSKSLLAGPVELVLLGRDGKELPWRGNTRTIKTRGTVEADISGVSRAGNAELAWNCRAEFDGFLRYDFSMPAGASGGGLKLRIPLKTALTTLRYTDQFTNGWRGKLPPGEGVIWSMSFINYLWLGNEELGLCAFQEDDRGWIKGSSKGLSLERSGEVTTLVYQLSPGPFKLDAPWTFTFGLQATPVKPMPKDWRLWRERGCGPTQNMQNVWPNRATDIYFSPPSPKHPQSCKDKVAALHAKGLKVIPYSGLNFIAPYHPDYVWFRRDWGRYENSQTGTEFPAHTFVSAVPSWVEFIVWQNIQLMDRYDFDGIYIDYGAARFRGHAPDLGLGYERNGQKVTALPIFSTREIYKRVYTAFKERDPGNLMWAHTSAAVHVPILSFCDVWLDGEGNWKGQLRDNYLEVLPLDVLRAEFMGHQYGAVQWMLPQWYGAELEGQDVASRQKNGKPEVVTVEKAHHLFGLGLLHDFSFWPICGMNPAAAIEFYGTLDVFGIEDAEFFGYWNNQHLIGGQSDAIKVSAYRRPPRPGVSSRPGSSLFCVYNTTRESMKATLEIDWKKWMLRGYPNDVDVRDAYTYERLKVNDNRVTMDVPPFNYRLLWVR